MPPRLTAFEIARRKAERYILQRVSDGLYKTGPGTKKWGSRTQARVYTRGKVNTATAAMKEKQVNIIKIN